MAFAFGRRRGFGRFDEAEFFEFFRLMHLLFPSLSLLVRFRLFRRSFEGPLEFSRNFVSRQEVGGREGLLSDLFHVDGRQVGNHL